MTIVPSSVEGEFDQLPLTVRRDRVDMSDEGLDRIYAVECQWRMRRARRDAEGVRRLDYPTLGRIPSR